jgi:hypothetical protein
MRQLATNTGLAVYLISINQLHPVNNMLSEVAQGLSFQPEQTSDRALGSKQQ